jgi:hypothetical protein
MSVCLPNEWRISCRPSSPRPDKPTFRNVLTGRCARAELGTLPACRLHARVRERRAVYPDRGNAQK